jgi:hypothetical protein
MILIVSPPTGTAIVKTPIALVGRDVLTLHLAISTLQLFVTMALVLNPMDVRVLLRATTTPPPFATMGHVLTPVVQITLLATTTQAQAVTMEVAAWKTALPSQLEEEVSII